VATGKISPKKKEGTEAESGEGLQSERGRKEKGLERGGKGREVHVHSGEPL